MAKINTKADHCVMITNGMQCRHCGDLHKIPMPNRCHSFGTLAHEFAERHKGCKKTWTPPTPDMSLPMSDRIEFWLQHGERGSSAETIYNQMVPGYKIFGSSERSHPYDADDFRRCYLLLKMVPEWKKYFTDVMAKVSDTWEKLTTHWEQLTTMLEFSLANDGDCRKINELIKKCIAQKQP